MTLAKDIASHLLKIQAVLPQTRGAFHLGHLVSSHPFTLMNRVTLAYPETRTLIENGFVEAIKDEWTQDWN